MKTETKIMQSRSFCKGIWAGQVKHMKNSDYDEQSQNNATEIILKR